MKSSASLGFKIANLGKWIFAKIRKIILTLTRRPASFIITNFRELLAVLCVMFSLFAPFTEEFTTEEANIAIGIGTAVMAAYFMYARAKEADEKKLTKETLVRGILLAMVIVAFAASLLIEDYDDVVNLEFLGTALASIILWVYQRPSRIPVQAI
ncbi:MAG: hypothetical protein ACE5OZ_24110 [Candidatus Heimdallarchaeota archaeon]